MWTGARKAHSGVVRERPWHHRSTKTRTCTTMNDIRQSFAQHGLVRSRDRRVLGGVLRRPRPPLRPRPLDRPTPVRAAAPRRPRQPDPGLPDPVDPDAVGGDRRRRGPDRGADTGGLTSARAATTQLSSSPSKPTSQWSPNRSTTCPSDAPQGRACRSSTTRPPSESRENHACKGGRTGRAEQRPHQALAPERRLVAGHVGREEAHRPVGEIAVRDGVLRTVVPAELLERVQLHAAAEHVGVEGQGLPGCARQVEVGRGCGHDSDARHDDRQRLRWCGAAVVADVGQASLRASSAATASGRNPLKVIQRPTVSSQAARGRVRTKAIDETWSMPPKRAPRNAANNRGAPISPTVGMTRGTRRDR